MSLYQTLKEHKKAGGAGAETHFFFRLAVIIIFIAVGFGVYFGWKKSKEILTPPMAEQGSPQGAASQTPEHQRLKILSDQPVFNYFIRQGIGGLATSSEIFYVNSSGQILKVSGGEDEIISDRIVENFQGIEADKSGDRIIVKYGLTMPIYLSSSLKTKAASCEVDNLLNFNNGRG